MATLKAQKRRIKQYWAARAATEAAGATAFLEKPRLIPYLGSLCTRALTKSEDISNSTGLSEPKRKPRVQPQYRLLMRVESGGVPLRVRWVNQYHLQNMVAESCIGPRLWHNRIGTAKEALDTTTLHENHCPKTHP